MIPLRDSTPNRRTPLVNYAMIALCTVGWVVELGAGSGLDELIHRYALIPARFLALGERLGALHVEALLPLVTSMFLHGGWMHFGGNMLFLWIFGDNVEDRFGHLGYLIFYLAGGVFAGLAHVAANAASVVPTIGASGAIAAVMGAYLILHPGARIQSLVLLGFFITTMSVPAIVYLGVWFALQLLQGAVTAADPNAGGVAWWAHAGGFAFGAAAILLLGRRSRARRWGRG